ncbi:TIGR02221 family CRISPR-associated protein [Pyrococcus yayanosii]|uniref:CRISPR-associated protein, TM1812 family n=1 Tax=Pyrococcus yayanosii (strain CH1 / JCM 16557) TaxID=529709 RepID=F8AJ01_PYRYC|nr:TIGR02221 family CRISPR-associated protein [Pyrococcus yayanosii]AEH24483.1 CRISPR-associated protein, TM1812 family [Pyrococcus yayanosii CH1]
MKLLSFIGSSEYKETIYFYEDKTVRTEYIQEALTKIFQPSEVIIFATKEAYKKHGEKLRERIENVQFVEIETPKTQEDIWSLFEKIVDSVDYNDEIILDITHAFRHIPFMSFPIILYLQEVKNVKIVGIYYGAFEAKTEKGAPIFDLSGILDLADWLYGVRDLKKYGRGEGIYNSIKNMNARFYKTNAPKKPKTLSGYADLILILLKNLQLNQIPEFMELSAKAKKGYEEFKAEAIEFLPPIRYTLNEIERLTEFGCKEFGKESLEKQLGIIEYLLEKGMTANALELMREWIINAVIFLAGEKKWLSKDVRIKAEKTIGWFSAKIRGNTNGIEKTEWVEKLEKNEKIAKLAKVWLKVYEIRNAIAHAGMKEKKDRPKVNVIEKRSHEILKLLKEALP